MTEDEAKQVLEGDGYSNISVWLDSPDFSYPEHSHTHATAHVIVTGDMTLTMNGTASHLLSGDRIDIPANTIHIATMGPDGCTYVSGDHS